jgi:hypothetical protein
VIAEDHVGLEYLQRAHERRSGIRLDYCIAEVGTLDGTRNQICITWISGEQQDSKAKRL